MISTSTRIFVTIGTILVIGFLMPLFVPEEAAQGNAPGEPMRLEASVFFSEFSDLRSDEVTLANKFRILIPFIVGLLLILAGSLMSGVIRPIVIFLSGAGLFITGYVIEGHPTLEMDILHRFTFWLGMLSLAIIYAANQSSTKRRLIPWIGLAGGVMFILYTTLPYFNEVQPGISIFRIPYQIIAEQSTVSKIFGYGLILVIAGWAFSAVMTGLNLLDKDLMQPSTIRLVILAVWGWLFMLMLYVNYVPLIGSLSNIAEGKLFIMVSVAWNFIKTAIMIFMPFLTLSLGLAELFQMKRFDK